ncbi:MAG: hypothetical protein H0W63_05240 [Gemmatimonadaceae bacterium]|nr:hypothetical protein [Gemmatimonadaceae bacterium]
MSFSEGRLAIRVERGGAAAAPDLVFHQVEIMRWKPAKNPAPPSPLDTVGLEKLGAGEVWRLYAQTVAGAEIEISCRTIVCDGAEVTGIGRSYRH